MRRVLWLLVILNIMAAQPAYSAISPNPAEMESKHARDTKLLELALEGQELVLHRRYTEALAFFRQIQRDYPTSPLGYFGEMAIHEVRMLENEDFRYEKEFKQATKQGYKAVSKVMQRYHPSNYELFYAAGVVGLDSFFNARKGKWWKAYTKGGRSRQSFRRILKKDPDFADAKLGEGMYIYWRSVFTKEYSFLPFFSDRRAEGIAMVEEVIEKAQVANHVAKVNLGLIFFEEKRYADAQKIFEDFISKYPENVMFRMLLGKVFLANKKYAKAQKVFEKTLVVAPEINKLHYFIGLVPRLFQTNYCRIRSLFIIQVTAHIFADLFLVAFNIQ